MPINSGWKDTIDNIIYPNELTTWDHYGNSSGSYFTITAVGGVTLGSSSGLNSTGAAVFADENAGYWRINYTDALRLSGRSEWTIDFFVRIDTDSTSTTNFQTANEGVIFASGEGGLLTDDGSTRTVDYAGTIDANRKFKFYYHDGATLNTITSTATIGVDDWADIKILYENSEIKISINGSLDSTTSASAGIRNTSNNFVLGGNSTGDYLYNARIDAFRIRRDAFGTANTTSGIAVANWNSIIDTVEASGWDENVLLVLLFNDGAGNVAKPRQTKLIPQTWGDWDYWFQVPSINIAFSMQYAVSTTVKGWPNTNITTTDGFICAYGAGERKLTSAGSSAKDTQWRPDFVSSISGNYSSIGHAVYLTYGNPLAPLETDEGYIGQLTNEDVALLGTTPKTINIVQSPIIPARGYLPLTQRTESIAKLDSTKIDSVSADAQYNQGMRPRGIKQASFEINQELFTQKIEVADNNAQRFYHGLPYHTINRSGTIYEGTGYSYTDVQSSTIDNKHDHDFRLGNTNTKIIKSISASTTPRITTHVAHGLTSGDKIFIRPGYSGRFKSYPFKTGVVKDHADAMHLHGQAYVTVIDSTSFDIYYDSGRSNQITMSQSDVFFNVPGYIITPNDSGQPYIKDTGHKMINWSDNFGDILSVDANADVVSFPEGQQQGPFLFDAAKGGTNITQYGTQKEFISDQNQDFVKVGLGGASFNDVKSIPKGDSADPIVIKTETTGTTDSTGGMMAMCMLDLDLPGNGTLTVTVSDIDTADSTTPAIEYYYMLNGVRENGTATVTQNTDADGSFTIAISGESDMAADDLRSIQLAIGLKDIVHASDNDSSRATYTISFANSDSNGESRIFWAGGHPPGYETLPAGPYFANESSSFNGIVRRRSGIVYQSTQQGSSFTVRGIPDIIMTNLGYCWVGGERLYGFELRGSGNDPQTYELEDVTETVKIPGSHQDHAPWVSETLMQSGQIRVYDGKKYQGISLPGDYDPVTQTSTYISAKDFKTDYDLGRWVEV
jgi:hypothetical protein